jgi:hypothetical protein
MSTNKKNSPLKMINFGGVMGTAVNSAIRNTAGAKPQGNQMTNFRNSLGNPLTRGFNAGAQISNPQSINNNPLFGGMVGFNGGAQSTSSGFMGGGFMGGGVMNSLAGATIGTMRQKNAEATSTVQKGALLSENNYMQRSNAAMSAPVGQEATSTITSNLNNNIMQKPQTPISPTALSNQSTINDVYGQMVPGTYNRSVGSPLQQMVEPAVAIDPLTGQQIDPTMDQSPSMPLPPPVDVQTGITPNYGINNL